MQKVVIRKATKKDLNVLLELAAELFEFHEKRHHTKNYQAVKNARDLRKKFYISMLRKPKDCALFIAEINNQPVGMIIAATENLPKVYVQNKRGFIREFYVREEYREKGVGKKLMQAATQWLRKKKFKTIALQCWASNTSARRAYEGMGFKAMHVKYEKII